MLAAAGGPPRVGGPKPKEFARRRRELNPGLLRTQDVVLGSQEMIWGPYRLVSLTGRDTHHYTTATVIPKRVLRNSTLGAAVGVRCTADPADVLCFLVGLAEPSKNFTSFYVMLSFVTFHDLGGTQRPRRRGAGWGRRAEPQPPPEGADASSKLYSLRTSRATGGHPPPLVSGAGQGQGGTSRKNED